MGHLASVVLEWSAVDCQDSLTHLPDFFPIFSLFLSPACPMVIDKFSNTVQQIVLLANRSDKSLSDDEDAEA